MWQKLIPNWLIPFIEQPKTTLPDISAGLMMAILVIPQSLGYAMLAGLPPVMGLYSAIVPTLVYAYIGSSSVNALGPVAITAVMTAGALSSYDLGSPQYIQMAITLALLVGVILLMASLLKLGWIMQFISRGVSAGFVSGAACLVIISQLKHLIGLPISGDSLIGMIKSLAHVETWIKPYTALLGIVLFALLVINRYRPHYLWGILPKNAQSIAKQFFAVGCVVVLIVLHHRLDWGNFDIATLSALPQELFLPRLPVLNTHILVELLPSALLIALIAFVSSASVAGNIARIRKQHFDNTQELKGLGFANVASSLFGGFPVTGGLSRTSLNIMLGAKSPLASVICGCGVLIIMLFFGGYMAGLPYVLLSAIIMSSMIAMIDLDTLKTALAHDKGEAINFGASFLGCVFFGLNMGLIFGLFVSFAGIIYRSHRVHIAVVGQVGDSEHFRNVLRHEVRTFDDVLLIRIDENLYFGNAQSVKDKLYQLINQHTACNIVIIMTAVNHLDLSAQEMLARLNQELYQMGKKLHFSEIKGPVMDSLAHTCLLKELSGQTFFSTSNAIQHLTDNTATK